jgi:DNA-binding MarR family transcriptional regulator
VEVRRLIRLARQLREIALKASQGGADFPLSIGELAIVENVARHPDSAITEIARSTGLAQSRVSRVVQDLSTEGVLQFWKDPRDRRQTLVRLDPEIRQQTLEDYSSRTIAQALTEATPQLSPAQRERASQLLAELADLLATDSPHRD